MKTDRASSTHPPTSQPPPTTERPKGSQRPTAVLNTVVEQEPPKTTLAGIIDFRPGRKALSDALERLEPHTAAEMFFKGEFKAGDAAKAEFKARIERRDDGTFEVCAENLAALGLANDHAGGFGGFMAGGKLVFPNADQAADFIHAAAMAIGVVVGRAEAPLKGAIVDNVMGLSRDAAERLARGIDRAEVLQLGGQLELEGELGSAEKPSHSFGGKAEAKAVVTASTQREVDFAKGCLTTRSRLEGKLEGEIGLKLGDSIAADAIANRFSAKGELKTSVALEQRWKLTPGTLEQIRRGELSPAQIADAVRKAPIEYVAVVKVEGEVRGNGMITGMGRLEASTEIVLDRKLAADLLAGKTSPLGELVNAKWEGKVEAALGGNQELDLKVVKVEAGATRWVTRPLEGGSIADVARSGVRWLDERQTMEAQLNAQRRALGD
ncbi:MAG: hypothetical protein SFW67_29045 [Myxococcaceae bacterium]|nr:hypothetical protein [Myxococcaceae bacterium]